MLHLKASFHVNQKRFTKIIARLNQTFDIWIPTSSKLKKFKWLNFFSKVTFSLKLETIHKISTAIFNFKKLGTHKIYFNFGQCSFEWVCVNISHIITSPQFVSYIFNNIYSCAADCTLNATVRYKSAPQIIQLDVNGKSMPNSFSHDLQIILAYGNGNIMSSKVSKAQKCCFSSKHSSKAHLVYMDDHCLITALNFVEPTFKDDLRWNKLIFSCFFGAGKVKLSFQTSKIFLIH